jgi:hypothetical protein
MVKRKLVASDKTTLAATFSITIGACWGPRRKVMGLVSALRRGAG